MSVHAQELALFATGGGLAALLAAEARGSRLGAAIAKPIASTGFVAFALARGAFDTGYGQLVLLGLVLSWLGDVLLIPKGARGPFLAGLASFLLAHVAYAVGFASRGLDVRWVAGAVVLAGAAAVAALRWLAPHVESKMRIPVRAYVGVITAMVIAAAGAAGRTGDAVLLAGALAFYVSDLAVARERFVVRSFLNKTWGLPLYYGGQLLIASTV